MANCLIEQKVFAGIWADFIRIIPFAAFVKDELSKYVFCNERYSRDIFNKNVEDLIGKTVFDLDGQLTPELIEMFNRQDLKLMKEGGELISDTQILCSDGKVHHFHELKSLYLSDETREKYILGIMVDVTEKVNLKEELSFEHDILTALLDNSADNIYFKDNLCRFLRVSKAFAARHNLQLDEMIGKTDFDLFGKTHSQQAFNDEQRIMKIGIPIVGKEELEDWLDGKLTWVSTSKMPYYDKEGKIKGTFGISRDITKLKKNEIYRTNSLAFTTILSKISSILLRHGSANFSDALKSVMKELSQFIVSKKSYVYYLEEKESLIKKIYEYPETPAIEPGYADIKKFKIWYETLGKSELVFDLKQFPGSPEYEFLEKNKLSHIVIIPLINYVALVGFIAFECEDTSKLWLKKHKALFNVLGEIISNSFSNYESEKYRLEAEEEMLKLLRAVNQSTNAIMILDNNGCIEYVNAHYSALTGYDYEEQLGKKPNFLLAGHNSQFNFEHVLADIFKGIPWEGKFLDTTKTGSSIWVQMSISPIRNSRGTITNILVIIEDITEKMVNESRNAVSQKLESIGQLAAGIAHEINTPMQFIGDNTTFLQTSLNPLKDFIVGVKEAIEKNALNCNGLYDEFNILLQKHDIEYLMDEIPHAIQQTLTGVAHVSQIVKAMKDFAHPGKKEKTYSDINRGIEVTGTISKNEWKYVAELELKLTPDLPPVYCLHDELNQVFLGMIINAAHAIAEKKTFQNGNKGKIVIETFKEKNFAVVRINDNGMGIKESNLPRIFDPFFTTKDVGRGTGQGLTIAHDLVVNKHGGEIFVESIYGEGTTFTIKIPIEEK